MKEEKKKWQFKYTLRRQSKDISRDKNECDDNHICSEPIQYTRILYRNILQNAAMCI